MKARDVMVSPVITVKPSSGVKEVAKIFLERRISAAPVVDDQGKLVGIVSEGDLMHRAEAGIDLWGITRSDAERKAIRVAAESTPGVSVVNDNLITRPRGGWT